MNPRGTACAFRRKEIVSALCIPIIAIAMMFFSMQVFAAPAAPRIVPAPKKMKLAEGSFMPKKGDYILLANAKSADDKFAASLIAKEFETVRGLKLPVVTEAKENGRAIILGTLADAAAARLAKQHGVEKAHLLIAEGYVLSIGADAILLAGADADGTFYAAQTLRMIVRQTPKAAPLPVLRIDDWPEFHFRGITDDISRGPVPTMAAIKQNIDRLAELKLNKFNFYIEHVFCYEKHPLIGPKGGCLTAGDMKEIERYAKQRHIELVGGLQSFGHMEHILDKAKYSPMAENPLKPWSISPANKNTYKFMDELYSEIAPAFSSKLFNISCDETWDLGTAQTRALVQKEGIAKVYAGHINKLHGLLAARGKRVLMWADIALKHPDILGELPMDLIFLPWGYSAQDDFKDQLVPISKTGHDFIVCPGVSCWGRMFPNINTAEKNIRSFTRDGALYNALGVLNTTWDDSGENLFGYNWYPVAWGAETSWNPVNADIAGFRAAFSQSFYGTQDDSAALGVRKLADAAEVFDYQDLRDAQFWVWPPASKFPAGGTAVSEAKRLRNFAKDAEAYFLAAKKAATANRENLDYPILAARRIANLADRNIDYYKCARLYKAAAGEKDAAAAFAKISEIRAILKKDLAELASIGKQYEAMWMRENRPYWLDNNQKKYDTLAKTMKRAEIELAKAAAGLKEGRPLPPADKVFNTGR